VVEVFEKGKGKGASELARVCVTSVDS
jgi:hypothetical protein